MNVQNTDDSNLGRTAVRPKLDEVVKSEKHFLSLEGRGLG